MNRRYRHNRQVRIDHGRALVVLTLRTLGVNPSQSQLDNFQAWRIKQDWKRYQQERMQNYTAEQNSLNALPLHFPNGKKGEEYSQSIQLDLTKFDDVWAEGLEASGLKEVIVPESGTITLQGISPEARDYTFKLCFKLHGWEEGDPILERKFSIAFNQDPRELWVSRPVPDNIQYPKPDEDSDLVDCDGKQIVVASKRGRSHAQEGKPRDDDFSVSFNPDNGWHVLAVADGAGSAHYSREGSRVACETVKAYCRHHLAEQASVFDQAVSAYEQSKSKEDLKPFVAAANDILFKAAMEAYRAISKKVDDCQGSAVLKDFSTTLLLAICRKFDFGWFVASFGVGDGTIAIYDRNSDQVTLLNEPDGGEYAGQTRFLTMKSIFSDRPRIRVTVVPDFTALMLMTDGISDPFFETDANLARKEKWDALWADLPEPLGEKELLNWLDFWSAGNHDDRTIAILH